MAVVKCPECQTKLRSPADRATFKCPRCGKVLRLPPKAKAPAPAPPPPSDDELALPSASETSSEIPVASETQSELPVLAGVDPDKNLPPLAEEEPDAPPRKGPMPQVHVPTLGVKGFDLAEGPPAPPPRRKWRIEFGRLQIRPLRLAVALALGLVVLAGILAAQSVMEMLFGR